MKHSWICIDESCSLHTSPRNSTEMQLHCQIVSISKPCRILRFPPGSREPCIASNIFRSFSFSSRSSRIRRSSARNAWLPRGWKNMQNMQKAPNISKSHLPCQTLPNYHHKTPEHVWANMQNQTNVKQVSKLLQAMLCSSLLKKFPGLRVLIRNSNIPC